MRTLIAIPARLNSQRLPRKVLLAETGKPLIQHVVDQAAQSRYIADCGQPWVFADPELFHVLTEERLAGCQLAMTAIHPNGTGRVGSIARADDVYDAYCIVQADVPEISPDLIDQVISELERHPEWDCATAAYRGRIELDNPNRVKVLTRHVEGCLLAKDFSRHAASIETHIGIYCYRREALLKYAAAGPCEREQAESLEQLRALHIGLKMGVVLTEHAPAGIDTPEDYHAFVERWRASHAEAV